MLRGTHFSIIDTPEDVSVEDGGAVRYFEVNVHADDKACICPPPGDEVDEACPYCNGMFFRVHSWDASGRHIEIKKFEGKKVRVTIEVLED